MHKNCTDRDVATSELIFLLAQLLVCVTVYQFCQFLQFCFQKVC